MNKFTIHFLLGLAVFLSVVACKPKITDSEITAGEVDPTRFVSIGGSVTAGFMDDALYEDGQQNSLGAILAKQFELIGSSNFYQPLMPPGSIGCNEFGKAPYVLGYSTDCLGVTSLAPIRKASNGDNVGFGMNIYNSMSLFRNYGIPAIHSTDLTVPGLSNPYFQRIASSQLSGTVKGDILAVNPKFFSLFMGMDEVMEYAESGASSGMLTPANGAVGVGFDGSIHDLLVDLTGSGAKGVISTIPDVTEMPFFTTIPYNGLNLDAANAQTLNDIYNPIGIYFQVGPNAFVIEDPSAGAFGVRKMVEGECILLSTPLDSVKCYKMGSVFPFRNEFILTQTEISEIQNAIDAYNQSLTSFSTEFNLALVDGNAFFKKISTGFLFDGIAMSGKFVSGGMFSLDGKNLNPRGNALFANEFIKSINAKYKSNIPTVDATKFRGVIFP